MKAIFLKLMIKYSSLTQYKRATRQSNQRDVSKFKYTQLAILLFLPSKLIGTENIS